MADSINFGRDYEKEWHSKIGRELWVHMKAREVMNRFNTKNWNELVKIMSSEKNKNILGSINRDNFMSLALRLGIREPRLWSFADKLF